MMALLRDPWNWFLAHFLIGLAGIGCFAMGDWRAERQRKPGPFPTSGNPVPDELGGPIARLVLVIVVALFWLPIIIVFFVSEAWQSARDKRHEAWLASPAGKAETERRYREDIEKEIRPWISPDWLTRRNVPRAELDEDYREYQQLFQRDRDLFEALMARIEPGDEIACFATPEETWRRRFGRAGWAIVREGKVVAQLDTVMN